MRDPERAFGGGHGTSLRAVVRPREAGAFASADGDRRVRSRNQKPSEAVATLEEVPRPTRNPLRSRHIVAREPPRFVNAAELECAQILDWYGIPWEYEPRSFVLERDAEGRVTSAFTPDFYLPEQDLYIEVTVMKQSLVTRKNRKLREVGASTRTSTSSSSTGATSSASPSATGSDRLVTHGRRAPARDGTSRSARSTSIEPRSRRASPSSDRDRRRVRRPVPLLVAPLKSSTVFLADLSRALGSTTRSTSSSSRRTAAARAVAASGS